MNKKYKDLDQAIDELIKSSKTENLDEDLEDEELEEPTETVEDEVEKSEDDTEELEEEPIDDVDEEVEEEPVEEEEEVEEPEEESEDEDGYMELDEVVEEVTNRIMDNIKDYINEILENKEEPTVNELASTVEKSLDIMKLINEKIDSEIADREENDMVKGLSAKVDNLDKLVKSRKSYSNNKNLEVIERFDEKRDVEDLSKSERVDILSRAFQAGNKDINLVDITNAELGRTLSNNAVRVLRNSIGK